MLEFSEIVIAMMASKAQFIIAAFAAITVLAWLKTGREALEWKDNLRRSGRVNVAIAAFNIVTMIIPIIATGLLLSLLQGLPHVPVGFWDDTPWIIRALVALITYDLANYTMHRWSHANRWLWPMHAVHHSDTDLHFLSANRAHILEWVVIIPAAALVAYFCGLSVTDVALLGILREVHQYYVHSKLDWSHGSLRYVIASPRFHRWHHVDREEAHNKNFALFFPFIDLAFGTYHVPGPAKDLPTGFSDNPGENAGKLIAYPFLKWGQLIQESYRKVTGRGAPVS